MRIFLLAFCLLTLHSNPTWAKKREPVIVNPETVQKLADNYAMLTTLGAKLDSATITVEERYELIEALAITPRLLDDVHCGEGNKLADYCTEDEKKRKKAKQKPVYNLRKAKIETSVGEATLTEIFFKHQEVNTAFVEPFSSCSVGRIRVHTQGITGEWEPLQADWQVFGPKDPPWPFAAVSCEEAADATSYLPESMEEAIAVIRDQRCGGTNTLVLHESSWNIELIDNGIYEKTVLADCWIDEEHRFSSEEKPYFSQEVSLRPEYGQTWGYYPTISNDCSGYVCEKLRGY